MRIIKNPRELVRIISEKKSSGKNVGLVPTMGALHEGHLSLIRCGRRENDLLIVSIFVNPAQFGPKEDFKRYPRTIKKDIVLCRKEGVDIVFSPGTKDIYPHGFRTYVDVQGLSQVLCGKSRPGHFRAVATIVAKLFNIVQPDTAYFGQKDAQQALIIRRMVKDLNMPVEIRILPTVREKNGLAMSSRNIYLSPKQRLMAPVLYKALKMASRLIRQGNRNYQSVIEKVRRFIQSQSNAQIDYISIVDLDNLAVFRRSSGKCLIALAVRIGKTRLIDNLTVKIK